MGTLTGPWGRITPPIDPTSEQIVTWLCGIVESSAKRWGGPAIGGGKGATRRYVVPADQPLVHVAMPHPHTAAQQLIDGLGGLPIPPEAQASLAGGNDHVLLILQPMPDGRTRCFEVWHTERRPDGSWKAGAIGATPDLEATIQRGAYSTDEWPPYTSQKVHGHYMTNGTSASGMPIAAGQIQIAPLLAAQASGRPEDAVGHALALCLPDVRGDVVCAPATRTDGTLHGAGAPYGAKLILPASYEPPSDATFAELVLLRAAQNYGLIVRERTHSNVSLTAEGDDAGTVHSILGGALQRFPWSSLQVVQMNLAAVEHGHAVT